MQYKSKHIICNDFILSFDRYAQCENNSNNIQSKQNLIPNYTKGWNMFFTKFREDTMVYYNSNIYQILRLKQQNMSLHAEILELKKNLHIVTYSMQLLKTQKL